MGFILEISLVINSTLIRQDYVWEIEAVGSDSGLVRLHSMCPGGDTVASVSEASLLEMSVRVAN